MTVANTRAYTPRGSKRSSQTLWILQSILVRERSGNEHANQENSCQLSDYSCGDLARHGLGEKLSSALASASRLDPIGMAEVHLRLALLYNGAGMKDKAAVEYEEFLRKRPDYADRKKLEKYIAENKRQ